MVLTCALLESDELLLDNKLDETAQCGIDVSRINAHAVRTLQGVRLESLRYDLLADAFQVSFD